MKALHTVAMILVLIGALNWGLVGLFEVDVVAEALGPMTAAARTIYVLIGVAALVVAALWLERSRTATHPTRPATRHV